MRLLTGVGPRMHGQGASLDEALVAILDGAMIRALIGMYTIMATEIRLAIKRLARELATFTCLFFLAQPRISTIQGAQTKNKSEKRTLPQCSQEQLKSRPLPGAMIPSFQRP